MKRVLLGTVLAALAGGCEKPVETGVFKSAPVVRRDIVVAVEAAGLIEPFLTVEVKSKASGEILSIEADTGDVVEEGTRLVQIDKRVPRNQLAQAEAELEAATARRAIAETQSARAKKLFETRTINEVDYEQTVLELANAKAEVVRAQVAVENARIALEDTDVRAPMNGTIIEKLVEKGQVISSPTMDVGGGTLLLKMADLSSVQVKALVDETDIGKIVPGQAVTVTVTAFPNQPFDGRVLKVEPQATAEQTVTTFAVMMVLENSTGLLRPGMNADVEIRVAERRGVIAVPTSALRTVRDIPVAAQLVGMAEPDVRAQLGQPPTASSRGPGSQPERRSRPAQPASARDADGAEAYRFGSRYWVFLEDAAGLQATNVETGLTDLDYSEVISGLDEGDEVLLLPSSGLVQSQQRLQQRMRQFTSLPGMSRQDSGSN
jgi:HlyD family secretion protein